MHCEPEQNNDATDIYLIAAIMYCIQRVNLGSFILLTRLENYLELRNVFGNVWLTFFNLKKLLKL